LNCLHPDCTNPAKPYGGRGPRSSYCPEHSAASYRKARSRAGIDLRPACCRAQGKGMCAQHRKVKVHSYGQDLLPDSRVGPDDSLTSRELAAAQIHDAINAGLRISSPWRAINPVTTWARESFPVIGQPDLTCDWTPANPCWRQSFGESTIASRQLRLVGRGPEWPWS
jgi:hypothetical protein